MLALSQNLLILRKSNLSVFSFMIAAAVDAIIIIIDLVTFLTERL